MLPNDNSDASINVWCDWLMDNGYESDDIRFEEVISHHCCMSDWHWTDWDLNGFDIGVNADEGTRLVGGHFDFFPNEFTMGDVGSDSLLIGANGFFRRVGE